MADPIQKKVIRCECGKRLKVAVSQVGRRAECPFCHKVFFIPPIAPDPFEGLRPDASILTTFRPRRLEGEGKSL